MEKQENNSEIDVTELIARWKSGDECAASELFERYQRRLFPLVASKLGERMRRRLEPEDMVMSIMRSVFRMTGGISMDYTSEDGFWKWFVTVALNKTRDRIDKEMAKKRGLNLEVDAGSVFDDRIGGEPNANEVVEFTDLLDRVMNKLTENQRQVLLAKLEGLTHAEIAQQLGVNPKTIQRMGPQLRRITASVLGDDLPEGVLQQAEYSGYWDELLQEKLRGWVADETIAQSQGSKTLGAALHANSTAVDVLSEIRSTCKHKGRSSNDVEDQVYPAKTLSAAYLLAIAQGQLIHGHWISTDPPALISERIRSILAENWLDPKSRQILEEAIHKHP